VHHSHGVGLVSLELGAVDGLLGLRLGEVRAVEEGVDGGVALPRKVVVPGQR